MWIAKKTNNMEIPGYIWLYDDDDDEENTN